MAVTLNPYLNFKDTTREAMEFYHGVFGGKLDVQTFKDFGAPVDADEADLVMHSMLTADSGLVLMGADTPRHMDYKPGSTVNLSLSGDDEATLSKYFAALSEGGTVSQPLQKAQWGDTFGMCTDKFGINWLVNISGPKAA